jgi:hypothetical protein
MASNALLAQREMTQATGGQSANVGRARDTVWLLTSTAATTREAVMLAKDNLTQLQELALQGEASQELLDAISQLCDGEHPAADILRRARNKVGFHWDEKELTPVLRKFGKHQKIVWLESDGNMMVNRLAFAVLAQVLLRDAAVHSEPKEIEEAIKTGVSHVTDAIDLILTFFAKSTFGYLLSIGVEVRSRAPSSPDAEDRTGDDASPRSHEE